MNSIEDVLIALRRIIRATDLHSKHLEKTTGLTAPQLLLLQILRDEPDKTVGEVAKGMSLSQATVTTIIDRLETRKLLTRRRSDTDKRKVYATLTAAGKKLLENAPTPLQHYFAKQFQALQDWEQSAILSALQRIALMMDAQHLDASPVLDLGALDRQAGSAAAPLPTGQKSSAATPKKAVKKPPKSK